MQGQGRLTLWRCNDQGLLFPLVSTDNQWQYDWGYIACRTIAQGRREYRIQGMYVEFDNVTNPGDQVTPPTFGREEGREYYDNLSSSTTRDYLRVPLWQEPLIEVATGYESYFDATKGEGNKAVLMAKTSGTQGVHGKPFDSTSNSTVIGAALIASPDWNDPTRDIIFARAYYPTGSQVLKDATHQIGLTWELTFK